jgi:hypothetical protein
MKAKIDAVINAVKKTKKINKIKKTKKMEAMMKIDQEKMEVTISSI